MTIAPLAAPTPLTLTVPEPEGRVNIAFNDPTLTWDPEWTCLDELYPNLITSYTIDRGRQYELDRTDVGRAVVSIADVDGILDPTNIDGPFFGLIEPLLQIALGRWNPITDAWHTRFRGFIEELDYSFDPSQRVNRLTLSCVDLFEILGAVELVAGFFGDPPTTESGDQIMYRAADSLPDVQSRIVHVLNDVGMPDEFSVVFTGNVDLRDSTHSPGETALSVIQEFADAEFPGVSNVYCDRAGRIAFHGRQAKFDPEGVHGGAAVNAWLFHTWKAGDGAAVAADVDGNTAQIRVFAFNRGLSKIINTAVATPMRDKPLTPAQMTGQLVKDDVGDTSSVATFGIRSWSAMDLLTAFGRYGEGVFTDDLTETKRFATYYVENYKAPRNRITDFGFRSIVPSDPKAPAIWRVLTLADIADTMLVTVNSPGGGIFTDDGVHGYFIEGIHEQCQPTGMQYDDVTMTMDLSPRSYFTSWPFTGDEA